MQTHSEGELDSLVSLTPVKPWFVTDRHLMLKTWLFLCVYEFWQLYIPQPLSYNQITQKGHQLPMIKSHSNDFFDSSVEKKIRKKCHAMFSGFLIVDYSKRKNYIFTNEPDQRQRERMNRRYAMMQINNIFWYETWIVQYRIWLSKEQEKRICNKLILLLNQILHYQVSLFTRFLLKVVFLISFKDTGANPLIVSRAPIRAVKSSGSVSLLTQGARVERLYLLEFLKPTSYWKFHEGGGKIGIFYN